MAPQLRHVLVARVLMAAAHADEEVHGHEHEAVTKLLEVATGRKLLPPEVGEALRDFDLASFDLKAAVAALDLEAPEDKRHLLELVAAVHEADEILDLAEDAFLRQLAALLGVPESTYADLVVGEVVVESAGKALIPPPLPQN